ncbi:hypothetical protein BH23BAC1_BH23BAC1_13480 [soil metagenome]
MDVKISSYDKNLDRKNNLFIFDDTPLYFIAREIEDFFGIQLLISNDSLANQKITAKVPRDHPKILFNVLSETLQVKITKKGNSFFMDKN